MKKKIWLYGVDPGGANVLFPLLEYFKQKGLSVQLFGGEVAANVYEKREKEYEKVVFFNEGEIASWIEKGKPHLIVTGTSANDHTEEAIWRICRQFSIPTLAILDQWMNYGVRFSKLGSQNRDRYIPFQTELELPNKIAVPDQVAYEEAKIDGIPEENMKIVGHPYLEWLNDYCKERRKKEKESIFLFASEPLSSDFCQVVGGAKGYFGYDEYSTLEELVKALNEMQNVKLKIRLHPREGGIKKFESILKKALFCWQEDGEKDNLDSILESDLVIGMSSMLLIEAYSLGKKVVSLQYNRRNQDTLILSKKGFVEVVLRGEDTISVIENTLKTEREERFFLSEQSLENTYQLVEVLLCQN